MHTLLFLSLAFGGLSALLTLLTHVSVLIIHRRRRKSVVLPAISILKPLKGEDDGLYENLVSIARQNYPEFEILFGCEDPRDPALRVARRVQREFPQVPMRVFAGCSELGRNPKVNNLRMLSAHARHDCVLISDSNVRARPDYLSAMAAELADPRVGLVSSVLAGTGARTLGARLDNLHMNSSIARGVCGASVLVNHPCVIGKSMLLRLSQLEQLGGFAAVNDVLAEDYVLGQQFRRAGFRVALSAHVLEAVSVHRTIEEFCARHVRWSQMRRRLVPSVYFLEPLESPVPWLFAALALASLSDDAGPSHAVVAVIALALLFRLASDGLLCRALSGKRLTPADYAALVLKDLLFVGIWAAGAVKRTVSWRGNKLRIGEGSRLQPLRSPRPPAAAFEGART